MLNKLRFRLTVINLLLISTILFVIFSGIYLLMKDGMQKYANALMNTIALQEQINPIMLFPDKPPLLSNCFFVKTDNNGTILETSSNLFFTKEDTKNLAYKVLESSDANNLINYNNYTLKFLKTTKSYGFILVFLDNRLDSDVLKRLITTSIVVGLISLIFVFFISLYLSDRAIIPIKKALEKQSSFVADASHELRTPLAVINSNLEIVMDDTTGTIEGQWKWLSNIHSELGRMTQLVDDLLFLARADTDSMEMPISPLNLSEVLEKFILLFQPFAHKKRLELIYEIDPNIIVNGNEGRLRQLIAILLDNSIKYTSKGGQVCLAVRGRENIAEIIISDTGEGIPREHLDKIFERFYRVDKSRSRNYGGTGLGLAIAKCIVTEHSGSINVTSTIGTGTEFRITLPTVK